MRAVNTLMVPGEIATKWLLFLFEVPPESQNPELIMLFAGLLSFLFWLCVLRFVGQLAMKILGFERGGRY